MEKKIVVTMTVDEAKRLERDCLSFKKVLEMLSDNLPKIEEDEDSVKFAKLAMKSHYESLEKITDIFRT